MECDKIRNLINDYIDNELDERRFKEVEKHLKICPDCGKLEKDLRANVVDPLRNSERIKAPLGVWQKVEEAISVKTNKVYVFRRTLGWAIFLRKKPILIPVALMIMFLLTIFITNNPNITKQQTINNYLLDQIQSLSELSMNGEEDSYGSDLNLDTAIERYLFI